MLDFIDKIVYILQKSNLIAFLLFLIKKMLLTILIVSFVLIVSSKKIDKIDTLQSIDLCLIDDDNKNSISLDYKYKCDDVYYSIDENKCQKFINSKLASKFMKQSNRSNEKVEKFKLFVKKIRLCNEQIYTKSITSLSCPVNKLVKISFLLQLLLLELNYFLNFII